MLRGFLWPRQLCCFVHIQVIPHDNVPALEFFKTSLKT